MCLGLKREHNQHQLRYSEASLKDRKQRKSFIKSVEVIKEVKHSPELLLKFSYNQYTAVNSYTALFASVQHIPSFLMSPLAEPLWSFQVKNKLALLLDMKRQPWKNPRKITVLIKNSCYAY